MIRRTLIKNIIKKEMIFHREPVEKWSRGTMLFGQSSFLRGWTIRHSMQRVATQNDKQGKHAGKSLQVLFCDGVLFGPSFPPPLLPFSRGFFSEGSKTLDFRVWRNIKSPRSNPMEADPWSARFSSKRHQSALHSRSGQCFSLSHSPIYSSNSLFWGAVE